MRYEQPFTKIELQHRAVFTSTSSDASCTGDQDQSCPERNQPAGSRDVLPGGCEAFGRDHSRHGSHCAQVHDPENEQDGSPVAATEGAVKSKTYALSPSRAGVRRQGIAAPWVLPAAGEVMRFPLCE